MGGAVAGTVVGPRPEAVPPPRGPLLAGCEVGCEVGCEGPEGIGSGFFATGGADGLGAGFTRAAGDKGAVLTVLNSELCKALGAEPTVGMELRAKTVWSDDGDLPTVPDPAETFRSETDAERLSVSLRTAGVCRALAGTIFETGTIFEIRLTGWDPGREMAIRGSTCGVVDCRPPEYSSWVREESRSFETPSTRIWGTGIGDVGGSATNDFCVAGSILGDLFSAPLDAGDGAELGETF